MRNVSQFRLGFPPPGQFLERASGSCLAAPPACPLPNKFMRAEALDLKIKSERETGGRSDRGPLVERAMQHATSSMVFVVAAVEVTSRQRRHCRSGVWLSTTAASRFHCSSRRAESKSTCNYKGEERNKHGSTRAATEQTCSVCS